MTVKELQRLRRQELLQLLVEQGRAIANLKDEQEEKPPLRERIKSLMKTTYSMKNIMKTALLIFFALDIVLVLYLRVLAIRRKRKRKLEKARRERQRIRQEIRAMYGERL